MHRKKQIKVCLLDFDGTLVTEDILTLLCGLMGKSKESRELNDAFNRGEVFGFAPLVTRINFLASLTKSEIIELLKTNDLRVSIFNDVISEENNDNIAKDEFLDALGGSDDSLNNGKAAQWDVTEKHGKVSKTESDLDNELKDFRGEFVDKEKGGQDAHLFTGWQETNRANACGGERNVAQIHD